MAAPTIQQLFDSATRHHHAGRLKEAEPLYRQILARAPRHAEALHLLGVLAAQAGHRGPAEGLIRQSIALEPGNPGAHFNLGNVLKDKGNVDEAIACYRQAIARRPAYPEALGNLGNALQDQGRLDEAIAAYRQALALRPGYPEACYNLGTALQAKGLADDAIVAYRRAVSLRPGYPDAFYNLGIVLHAAGQLEDAIAAFRQAIVLRPAHSESHNNLGNALREHGQLDDSIAAHRQALALQPKYADAFYNLSISLKRKGHLDEALAECQRAIALKPESSQSHIHRGNVLKDLGNLDEALAAYRHGLALNPDDKDAHSNLIFAMHYLPGLEASAIALEHRRWNQRHVEPLGQCIQVHANDRDPDRRLRIGYVSPDFRDHVVGRNILPLLANHDRARFEIFAYANVIAPDHRTRQLRDCTDHWQSIAGMTDEQASDRIRLDKIDILVDLALHSARSRLLIFARKPAPLQVTFAGYPGSTGLASIDYRLSDPHLDPPGMDESVYSEKTIRLPDCFWCYDPLEDADIPVGALPAKANGYVTFGCLGNFCKVNDLVLALWSGVLRQIKDSRLLLMAESGSPRQRTIERLRESGIDPGRIEFLPFQPRRSYLAAYSRIDLGLDTFPYNGHTTSLDSLWMGVPIITLAGKTSVGRAGVSQLMNLNLPEQIAQTPEQFVQIAAGLAADLPRLGSLRSTLRQRMSASPIMNGVRFARNIESAYRQVWRIWALGLGEIPPG